MSKGISNLQIEKANTDSSDKDGSHWWSIMDIEPKTDLLFLTRLALMA